MIGFKKLREGADWTLYEIIKNTEPYIMKIIGQYTYRKDANNNRVLFYDTLDYIDTEEVDRIFEEWIEIWKT